MKESKEEQKGKNERREEKEMKNSIKSKRQKGITLIALVITIIVLLILAAVSIATLTGENGILSKANTAGERTKDAEEDERVKLAVATALSDNLGEGLTKTILENAIENEFGEGKKANLEGEENGPWTFKGERKDYKIEATGKIEETAKGSQEETGTVKTVAELYDGINDNNNPEYNENAMHIGDYVNYDAGNWEEGKPAPTSENPFEFGGYIAGQSRNTNATGGDAGTGTYTGWRIWDVSEDKSTVTLISAGCPELYYHQDGTNYAYNSEQILTGEKKTGTLAAGQPSNPRNWNSDYVQGNATSARAMKKSDLDEWYGKYIDSEITDSDKISKFPENTANKLISVVENGMDYWLCSAYDNSDLYCVSLGLRKVAHGNRGGRGVRVLVSLESGVKFIETPAKKDQIDGFEYNNWSIE